MLFKNLFFSFCKRLCI